ncbi:hypothetical protein DICPUDRAFT_75586 [Dictyostelium purpureum]|uniref:FNIP repeat-containing protein n=1 Tax=Dictyostelium purpureum TaxID=5786 RepID=F0ZB32_DICPU|nr:uncharacterized protein DICPUDRAFT_75586 [Dictyostelium purpureum]EGC38848.1 hypothetical protein DICPUDRAFT_75586 [Dictyostelium purpureum]|eukprot:XP_003284642.1 hypothetical protein DICPUDRAFT_75586 [Dictyostelium purpureum]
MKLFTFHDTPIQYNYLIDNFCNNTFNTNNNNYNNHYNYSNNNNKKLKNYQYSKYLKSIYIHFHKDVQIGKLFKEIKECPNIDTLEISSYSFDYKEDIFKDCIDSLPSSIKTLKLFKYFGTPINPTYIKHFKIIFLSTLITPNTFGAGLTSLYIYLSQYEINFEYLPQTLLTLSIDCLGKSKIRPNSLPNSITSLCLKTDFNQVLDDILPTSLKELYLGADFNKDITPSSLPKNLHKFYYFGKRFSFKFFDQNQTISELLGSIQVPVGLMDFSKLLSLKGFSLKDFNETIYDIEDVFPKSIKRLDLLNDKSYLADDLVFSGCLKKAKVPIVSIKNLPIQSIKSLTVLCNFDYSPHSLDRSAPIDDRVKLFVTDQLSQILSFTALKSLSLVAISNPTDFDLKDFIPPTVKHLEFQFLNDRSKENKSLTYIIPSHIQSFKVNLSANGIHPLFYPDSLTCLELELYANITIRSSMLPKFIKTLVIKSSFTTLFELPLPPTLELLILHNNQNLLKYPDLFNQLFDLGILKLVDLNKNKSALRYIKKLRFKN